MDDSRGAFSWDAYSTWFGVSSVEPIHYDYGANIYYTGDTVYIDNQSAGSAEDYYRHLANQARAEQAAGRAGAWQPLGVFAVLAPDQEAESANRFVQLAVSKAGNFRGNYFDQSSDAVLPIRGLVDRRTQRAAFTIGDDSQTIYETGMYNLTHDEAPMLVHFDATQNQVWNLVRLTQSR